MADVLKYGWVYGGKIGQEMKIAANQNFYRDGGAFITASGSGGVNILATLPTADLVGWAEVPRAAVPGLADYWNSGTTSGAMKAHVITDPGAIFAMPPYEGSASLSANVVGLHVGIVYNATRQYANTATNAIASQMQLKVVDVDMTERVMYVQVRQAHVGV